MTLDSLKKFTKWLGLWVVIFYLITTAISQTSLGKDDTDKPGWFTKRSGVELVTDELTGCQYLSAKNGGITPRLDLTGRHIGCK